MFPELLIDKNKDLFLETKNPLYAWKAIEHARGFKRPIPDEILDYLWKTANELMKVAVNPPAPAKRPLAIAKALKLHKTGAGQGSAFTEYSRRWDDRKLALDTAKRIKYYGPDKSDYAFDEIAKKYHISKATARRNFLAHSKRWHLMAEQLLESGTVKFGPDGKAKIMVFGEADDFREASEILKEIERIQTPA
jgi:hypothetical protein